MREWMDHYPASTKWLVVIAILEALSLLWQVTHG